MFTSVCDLWGIPEYWGRYFDICFLLIYYTITTTPIDTEQGTCHTKYKIVIMPENTMQASSINCLKSGSFMKCLRIIKIEFHLQGKRAGENVSYSYDLGKCSSGSDPKLIHSTFQC